MRLGTSTNLFFQRPDGSRASLEETLKVVSEAGFRVFDLNFYDWSLPGSPFLTDGWDRWIEKVAEAARGRGLVFEQCHGYFFPFLNPDMKEADYAWHKELQRRSFACCRILGAGVCVLHPETDYRYVDYEAASLEGNLKFFEEVLAETKGMGLKIAVENMCDYGISPKRKYGAYPAQLKELADALGTDRAGVCWDFEHGDIMRQNQPDCLRYLKEYLLATHVSDTYSRTDNKLMHVLPLTSGTIDWTAIMQTLAEIDYQGVFCYEVHNYMNRIPDPAVPSALKLAYEIGKYLMGIYEGVRSAALEG